VLRGSTGSRRHWSCGLEDALAGKIVIGGFPARFLEGQLVFGGELFISQGFEKAPELRRCRRIVAQSEDRLDEQLAAEGSGGGRIHAVFGSHSLAVNSALSFKIRERT